ncbi:MAG: hypothetical protein M1817_003273 [Caeruleum heppii]|nr:MAG: hypothetical protein M1817_003273 [Caeruleum heppii]
MQKTGLMARARYRRIKKLPSAYRDSYRNLLNEMILGINTQGEPPQVSQLPPSQIGLSHWTSQEKEVFFHALTRLGRDNLSGISSAITTKSEPEVAAYLQLLRRGAVERSLSTAARFALVPSDHPAAYEISPECCEALELAGDELAVRQEIHERKQEEKRWKDIWLLDSATAGWIEGHLAAGNVEDQTEEDLGILRPAVRLLRLEMWLQLSNRIFMNPGSPREHENWQRMAEDDDEEPSIRATAFTDFYTLAVSLTRRLTQTALFCAMSRLRAKTPHRPDLLPEVRPCDVHAACDVLRLKRNAEAFWIGAARRGALDVYHEPLWELRYTARRKRRLEYDEVEGILRGEIPFVKRRKGGAAIAADSDNAPRDPKSEPSATETDKLLTDGDSDSDTSPEDITSTSPSPSPSYNLPPPPQNPNHHTLPTNQDLYATALDQRANHIEERRLWEDVLHQRPPSPFLNSPSPLPDEKVEKAEKGEGEGYMGLERPPREKKDIDEMAEWRDGCERLAEWEGWGRGGLVGPAGERMVGRERKRKRRRGELNLVGEGRHDHLPQAGSSSTKEEQESSSLAEHGLEEAQQSSGD